MKEKPAIFSPDPKHPQIPIDSENFSEVSLDSKPDLSEQSPKHYNPLEGLDSASDLQQQSPKHGSGEPGQEHSFSSDLTSSFAQLPNVASTVFSTFSRVIKGGSSANLEEQSRPGQDPNSGTEQSFNTAPVPRSTLDELYDQQHPQLGTNVDSTFTQQNVQAPTFFSPTDPILNHPSGPPPTLPAGSNTFRLGGQKKKTYAGIPGLSTAPVPSLPQPDLTPFSGANIPQEPYNYPQQPSYLPSPASANYFDQPTLQPAGLDPFSPPDQSQNQAPASQNKFSLSSFIPSAASSLLNKVPSVKDFAQNIKETINPTYEAPTPQIYEPPQSTAGFFTVESNQDFSGQQNQPPPTQVQQPVINPYNFNTTPFAQSVEENQNLQVTQPETETAEPATAQTVGPPPTFFNPTAVPTLPKGQGLKSSGNPYSNTRFGKSAIYANPALIPSTGQTPIIPNAFGAPPVPASVPPSVNLFNPVATEEKTTPEANNYFNPLQSSQPQQLFPPSASATPPSIFNPFQQQQNPLQQQQSPSPVQQPLQVPPKVDQQFSTGAAHFFSQQPSAPSPSLSTSPAVLPTGTSPINQNVIEAPPTSNVLTPPTGNPTAPPAGNFETSSFSNAAPTPSVNTSTPPIGNIEKPPTPAQISSESNVAPPPTSGSLSGGLNPYKQKKPERPGAPIQAPAFPFFNQGPQQPVQLFNPTQAAPVELFNPVQTAPVELFNPVQAPPVELFNPSTTQTVTTQVEAPPVSSITSFFSQEQTSAVSQTIGFHPAVPEAPGFKHEFIPDQTQGTVQEPVAEPQASAQSNAQPAPSTAPFIGSFFTQQPVVEEKQNPATLNFDSAPKPAFDQTDQPKESTVPAQSSDSASFYQENPTQAAKVEESKPVTSLYSDLPTSYPPPLESVKQQEQPSTLPSRSPFQAFFASTEQSSFDSVISNASSSTWDSSPINLQNQLKSPQKQEPIPQPNLGLTPLFDTFTHPATTVDQQNNFINANLVNQTENLTVQNDPAPQQPLQQLFDNYQQQVSAPFFDPCNQQRNNNQQQDNNQPQIINQQQSQVTEAQKEITEGLNQNNNLVQQQQPDPIPRFTPVNFFIETPNTSNTPDQSSNSIASFFDNPAVGAQNNQLASFFNQSSQAPQYFQPQNVLSQQSLIARDIQLQQQQQIHHQNANNNQSLPQGYTHAGIAATESFSSFRSESVSELREDFIDYDELPEEIMADEIDSGKDVKYRPVYYHWFYQTQQDGKMIWQPFSMNDSLILEDEFKKGVDATIVHTNGGRYDVVISERKRKPVYWKGDGTEVRRCSWFYKALDSRFVPYEEEVANKLEEEYKTAALSGEWHKKIPLPNGETVVFHGPSVIVHFLQSQNPDSWGSSAQPTNRPRVVKRGIEEFSIEEGEPEQIDHLLFMVHGIGKACDLKFRTIEEAVDEFRSIALQLVQSHYRTSCDLGSVGRVEVLPVSWHAELHSEEIGIDDKIKAITLESIPKLREFANETLLDILFYSSPVFAQHIIDFVGHTMNRAFTTFRKRNPKFSGGISVGGHSLGSLILFDLLCHQNPNLETENMEDPDCGASPTRPEGKPTLKRQPSQIINYTMGQAGAGQPFINYPQLIFRPKKFFALGSPISMFVTVRGIDKLGLDFKLPTCEGFYNVFHPFDPVAYRCEPLINPNLTNVKPVVIPHHKGRKRMHLELKETMARVGADIKQRILFTFKNTMQAVYSLTTKQQPDPQAIEQEVDKVLEEQLNSENVDGRKRSDSMSTTAGSDVDTGETDQPLGLLNQSRRVDYVLQEAPLEFFNEYLFALTSHVCYWESADTILFMMKEIYSSMGIQTDSRIPQNSLTIERPTTSNASS